MSLSREADELSLAFGCLMNNGEGTLSNIFLERRPDGSRFKIEDLR
jgi:hypothetical protein